jgi:hypothetical protein
MSLFSQSANLEIAVPDAAPWSYLKDRAAADETLDFTIEGVDFEVSATGFGGHRDELEGALVRVQLMLAVCTIDELQDQTVVDAVAATAVRRETRAWHCWRRGNRGSRPALTVRFA